eukprot:6195949-Pleurochrysis_carterae.AAC.1
MLSYRMLRGRIKLQVSLNRVLACNERICCFRLAQILDAPWQTRWRRPTRAASTNPVPPPIDDMQTRSPAAILYSFVRWEACVSVGVCSTPMFKRLSSAGPWHSPARRVALQVRSRAACSSSTKRA